MRAVVYAFAFLGGCCVMAVEVLGSRVLTPHFGAALYVWTAQIAVTLLCLAVGYWAGGSLAQYKVSTSGASRQNLLIGMASILTGGWMLCIPVVSARVLPLLGGVDLRVGALVGSALLFSVPLCLLACLPPLCVSLLALGNVSAGSAAGRVYAVSTFGGVVTTLCLGFWLIPAYSIGATMQIAGCAMLAAGVAVVSCHVAGVKKGAALSVSAFCLGVTLTVLTPRGLRARGVVYYADSPHAEVAVLDSGGYRTMLLDRVGHSVVHLEDLKPIDRHFYYLNALTVMRPRARRGLLLGVAGGCVLRAMKKDDLEWDAVEFDPKVLEVAQDFFGLPEGRRFRYVVADGRAFLSHVSGEYDLIVIDTYASGGMPRHLCSREAFSDARKALRPGGILVVNQLGSRTGQNSRTWNATWHTLDSVFRNVRAFMSQARAFPGDMGVTVIFASDGLLEMEWAELDRTCSLNGVPELVGQMRSSELDDPGEPVVVLTDDLNPIEGWAIESSALVRAAWRRMAR